ncbi:MULTISPECIES: carbohydrate ABC transporter permease [Modicisalibacter]|uniref:Carbohydrate ABC transporter permease n=1 Tax=Modicisalibacter tunisiensis TaxID=390637 RepID=A0ABS7X0Z1_9GAMM|nr:MULTISPECIES: carbohydrate ABC transporter permease [Modicisalibacter]KXS39355.1 MAG: multiple sugar transport system permease protein [Halomonadaceae bacterium T82-2]MBZ9568543.1 carbohydrate ABC transporter permease [Modicisalibacter tunisiensis]
MDNVIRRRTPRARLLRAGLYALLIAAALVYLLPLVVMVLTSVKPIEEIRAGALLSLPSHFTLDPWIKAWSSACTGMRCDGLSGYFVNSIKIVVPAVAISTLVGAINGYALTKWRFRGSELVFAMLLFGCFVPFQVVLMPMARTLGWLGLASSVSGLVLVHVVYGIAFTTLFFRNYYVAVPDEMINAAKLDGAGFFRIFWRILLPVSGPIITVSVIWQFTQIWNDFLFGVAFAGFDSQPVTVALNNMVNTSTGVKEYNVDMAAAMIAALPTLVVYVLAGKYFVRGLTAGSVKG